MLPPGPPGHFLLGNLPEFRRDILGMFTSSARKYGDVVWFRIPNLPSCLISHPDHIEYVLVTGNRNFKKHKVWRHLDSVFGKGLLTSEGDFWLRQRRLAQPAFHKARIASYAETMVAYTLRMLETWKNGETRNVHQDMMKLTLQIAAKTLFDADADREAPDVSIAMESITKVFAKRFVSLIPLPEKIPTPANIRFRKAVRRLDQVVYGIIQRRRESDHDTGDLLSMLLHVQDEDGSRMSDLQLRDEMITLFLAGHETTAIALSWIWYLLAQHPDVEEKLVNELRTVVSDRAPTAADLPRLPYTEMVVLEAMRLYPPAYGFGREALNDFEIGGYHIPAGTTIFVSQWVVHRDSRFFPDPLRFDPDRWKDGLAKKLPKFAYFPFGGGPRLCLGNSFAMMETILVLATVAPRFKFALVPNQSIVPDPSITLRPKNGIRFTLTARDKPRRH